MNLWKLIYWLLC